MTPGGDVEKVADDGAGGRGDDSDSAGKGGKRAFAIRVKQALGLEPGFELLEGELERPGTDRFHRFGHQLHLSALLIDRDPATDQHPQAVLGAEAKQERLAAEEYDRQLRLGILQREVDMARGGRAAVRDLALHPYIGVFLLHQFADLGDQFADRPDAAAVARLVEVQAKLGRKWVVVQHW